MGQVNICVRGARHHELTSHMNRGKDPYICLNCAFQRGKINLITPSADDTRLELDYIGAFITCDKCGSQHYLASGVAKIRLGDGGSSGPLPAGVASIVDQKTACRSSERRWICQLCMGRRRDSSDHSNYRDFLFINSTEDADCVSCEGFRFNADRGKRAENVYFVRMS